MKQKIVMILLLLGFAIGGAAQNALPDTLLFVFKLHGQTRKYEMTFTPKNDALVLNWRILRNLKWQKGSYALTPQAVKKGTVLSFLMPEDGRHVTLPEHETAYILSQQAYRNLKARQRFDYNHTEYILLDSDERVADFALLHVRDTLEGGEMWILDNPALPLVWSMQNNPLEINWRVEDIVK